MAEDTFLVSNAKEEQKLLEARDSNIRAHETRLSLQSFPSNSMPHVPNPECLQFVDIAARAKLADAAIRIGEFN